MVIITLCDTCAGKLSLAYNLRKRGGPRGCCGLCNAPGAEKYNAISKTAAPHRLRPTMTDEERDAARKRRWA